MERCGRDWSAAGALDVMLLYAGLFPDGHDLSMDTVAAQLGAPIIGRHSALGDALTAGEMFLRLLTLLSGQGITTFGAAAALQRRAMGRLRFDVTATGQGRAS